MKKNKLYILILALLSLQSCDNFLDIKPKGYTIPEYFDDYVKLMNSQYLYNAMDVYPSYLTDDIQLGEKDELSWFTMGGKRDNELNLYQFQPGQVFTPGNNDGIWNGAYENIFTYNAVINNVTKVPDAVESERLRLKAEALFGRAFEYLNLVNLYAKHYDATTAKTDLGVPVVLSEEVNRKYTRNTVQEVYDQILSDLKDAAPYLSDKVPYSFRPDKYSIYAFYAKVYLYMGQYDKALTNAYEALKTYNTLVDYKNYKVIPGQWGRIVTDDEAETEFPTKHNSPENIYTRLLNGTSYIFKSVCASDELLEVFDDQLAADGKDMREELFFATDSMNPGNGYTYFEGRTIFTPYIEMNVGLSVPEMMLIAAECEARTGTAKNARDLLNNLRDMRIKNNIHYTTDSKDELLKLVIDERRREFVFNGIYRLVDLKRMNKDSRFAKTISHTCEGKTWTLPANDPRYIMPVPQTVLDYNPTMPQYER